MSFQNFVIEHESCRFSTKYSQKGTIKVNDKHSLPVYYYEYVQGETFLKIQIDEGLEKDEKGDNLKKCDFILLNTTGVGTENPNSHVFFIELKGKDFVTACKQLETTISKYSKMLEPAKLHARIVGLKIPERTHAHDKFVPHSFRIILRNLKCSFYSKTRQMEERTGGDYDCCPIFCDKKHCNVCIVKRAG